MKRGVVLRVLVGLICTVSVSGFTLWATWPATGTRGVPPGLQAASRPAASPQGPTASTGDTLPGAPSSPASGPGTAMGNSPSAPQEASTDPVLGPSSFVQVWSAGPFARDAREPIARSSPMVAALDDKGPAVVVGDRSGYLYAFHLSDGTPVAGWPAYDGGTPIDSTPSVAPIGPGGTDVVYVGTGDAAFPDTGGYEAFDPSGHLRWSTGVEDPPTDTHPARGVQASLTIANLQGHLAAFAGSLGQESYALDAPLGKALRGWPWFSADSVFSTAAAADLYGNGRTELVVGGASSPGLADGSAYTRGGHLRILNAGGGLICHDDTDQEIDSSPAVGAFLPGGATGIVVGTGSYWKGASDTAKLMGFDDNCHRAWSDTLDGATSSSPALADIDGNGHLYAVEGTDDGSDGSVWVIDAATGQVRWTKRVAGRVIGSVVTADLSGGYQDLLVPTVNGVEVMDGRTGAEVTVLAPGVGFQNSPLVTVDPNGTVGITVAGYNGANEGVVYHYEIPGSDGAAAVSAGSWPMFHHDPQLSGVQLRLPLGGKRTCGAPTAASPGYDLVASDGGVFSFGQPYCGSATGFARTTPIVSAAAAPPTGGYWLAASGGGVFAFGRARFYGSASNMRLATSIVGIAATPDGRGYWLVAADGGVLTYGDAGFYGSAAGTRLSAPVVGMAPTPDGKGYRLVTATGEVYCFGDAYYLGGLGGDRLARPIVGMATDWATGGYWLVAGDGGVFNFGAPFLGSTARIHLAEPIKEIEGTENGGGYWLVGAGGGVFSFGDATFFGSIAGVRLAGQVVGLVGFTG